MRKSSKDCRADRASVIGSYKGLIGILLDDVAYIDVPYERVRIVSVE